MKRIIICCDGTWNKPGLKDRGKEVETNVEKMYKAIETQKPSFPQVKYYGQGVGTRLALTDKFVGGSTGLGIDRNIQDAYKFLMWSYEPGDEIYLFGFSRGAYTVRSLAGLIRNCGIMKPEYLHIVDEAYQLYRDRTELTHPESDHMKAFKKSYALEPETTVKFLGVWDTVGALGIPIRWFEWWNKRYLFHDVKLGRHVKFAYHALALDERRKVFSPSLWEVNGEIKSQVCEQVWFPGVHSNVGGGYADTGLSDIALQWMVEKAKATGLEFDEGYLSRLAANSSGELRDSWTGIFKITGHLLRAINDEINEQMDKAQGIVEKRAIIRNERIHYSCFERAHLVDEYKPKNLSLALERNTTLEPIKDNWQQEWLKYLDDFSEFFKKNPVKVKKKKPGKVVEFKDNTQGKVNQK
jgi:uncharacterized protein (DUF2235 family)